MKHYFFTLLAIRANIFNKKSKPRPPHRIRQYIELWQKKASLFYEKQTIDRPFHVVLRYSDVHADVVHDYKYPKWAELTTLHARKWIEQAGLGGQAVSMSRVDADDSYSIDFIEELEKYKFKGFCRLLHKWYRKYHVPSGKLTKPIRHGSPHFATIMYESFPDAPTVEDMYGAIGNHSVFRRKPHKEIDKCLALERITGYNVANRFRHGIATPLDPRFVGYGRV